MALSREEQRTLEPYTHLQAVSTRVTIPEPEQPRPPLKDQRILILMPPEQVAWLQEKVKEGVHRNRSAVVRELIDQAMRATVSAR